jgi:ABC-type transport system involved in multi-copper enzyme maturation permease subunit
MDSPRRDPALEHVSEIESTTYATTRVDDDDLEERKGAAEVTLADLQQLRWGPIFAGLLTAIGIFVLLTMLAVALGLQAAPGTEELEDMGFVAILVTSLIALVAFFVGGFIATWSSGVSDPGRSMVNGFLVWALWLVAVAVLGAFGIGAIAGAMGDLFGQISAPSTDIEMDTLIDTLRSSSWQSFLALSLTALSAALGGVVGAREDLRGAWLRVARARVRV